MHMISARPLTIWPDNDSVNRAMDDGISISVEDPETSEADTCLRAYYDTVSAAIGEVFDVGRSLDPDRDALRPPVGAFWIARHAGAPVGCCALKGNGTALGEIKRLWVAPSARGQGLATRLMATAEAQARTLGMTVLRLDTNRTLTAAIAMYRARGWREIQAFNDEPYADHWFEKTLSG